MKIVNQFINLFIMNFEDFRQLYLIGLSTKNNYIRDGQYLMTLLSNISPVLYDELTNNEFDCFYDNNKIQKTLFWLRKNWK